jgi:nicotinamidase/pyrazinamidase
MKALIIVDMENDFMPDRILGVKKADEIIPIINKLIPKFPLVVSVQDWHPPDHCSFAATHLGKKVGDIVDVKGVKQILWPVHCVQDTPGAEIVSSLKKDKIASHFYKGTDKWVDSYSAFFDNVHKKSTGLKEYLQSKSVKDIYLVGLATDYCVLYSALDAIDLGFNVYVVRDACRAINLKSKDEETAFATMTTKGAKIITSADV